MRRFTPKFWSRQQRACRGRSPVLPRLRRGGLVLLGLRCFGRTWTGRGSMTATGVAASWLAEGSGRDLSPSLGWEVDAGSIGGDGSFAEEGPYTRLLDPGECLGLSVSF
jgi:hypothetical protein